MKPIITTLSLFAAFIFITPVQAASEDECSIWICLPGGFPSGCGSAMSAMRDRIKDFKPPLPTFSSCAVNPPSGSGSHMDFDYGYAAYIPAHDVCVSWNQMGHNNESCTRYETIPAQYVKNTRCYVNSEGRRRPEFCTKTYHWAEVFLEGELAGPTYYFED